MPDLEQLIANWRRTMLTAGIKTPAPLEELESHLRDDIERQIESGINPQHAFENSVRRIGEAKILKAEFNNVGGTVKSKWRKAVLAAAVTNTVLGVFWVFMALQSLYGAYHILNLHVRFASEDVKNLTYAWSIELYGAILGFLAIVAACRLFKRQRSGITLTAMCAVLTIGGVFVDFFWRVSQTSFRGHLVWALIVFLSFPMVLLALCQKSELKEHYV